MLLILLMYLLLQIFALSALDINLKKPNGENSAWNLNELNKNLGNGTIDVKAKGNLLIKLIKPAAKFSYETPFLYILNSLAKVTSNALSTALAKSETLILVCSPSLNISCKFFLL
jgi:hypothetical protein